MNNSNSLSNYDFIKVLKSFSKEEVAEFQKLLESPFFNNHSTLVKLFSELKKFHPDYDDSRLTKHHLFNIASRGSKFSDEVFRKYFSRLFRLSLDYLNIVEVRSDPYMAELNSLYQLARRNVVGICSRRADVLTDELNNKKKLAPENYYIRHKLNKLKEYQDSLGNKTRHRNHELAESVRNLLTYFVATVSIDYNQIATNKITYNYAEPAKFVESVLKNLNTEKNLSLITKHRMNLNERDVFFLELVSCDQKLNSPEQGGNAYSKLRKDVFEKGDLIDDRFLDYLINRLILFCVLEQLRGNNAYVRDLFENYKFIFDNNLLSLSGNSRLNINNVRAIFSAV